MFEIGPALAAAARFWPAAWKVSWASLALSMATLVLALRFGGPAWIAAIPAALVARGGLMRIAFDLQPTGPGGLQVGRPEARLAAVWILVLAITALAVGAGIAWAWARTSLAEAASMSRGRIEVLNSWKATSGLGWRLLLAHLVLAAPLVAAMFAGPAGAWAFPLAEGAVFGGLWLPMTTGLMAYAWRTAA